MKKTFPVNINGNVFYIDEDAYELLFNYLDQLKVTFPGAEGEEIVGDIEARISELFAEKTNTGATAIVYRDVTEVIDTIGSPEEFTKGESVNEEPQTGGNSPTPPPYDAATSHVAPADDQTTEARVKKLYRNPKNKVLGGVLGGIATYFDWNANILRLLFLVVTIFTQVWPFTIFYLIAWMVMPEANTPRRILEQQGEPVTLGNVGKTVRLNIEPQHIVSDTCNGLSNLLNTMFGILGKCIMAVLGLMGVVGTLVSTGFLIFAIVALIAFSCFDSVTLLSEFDYNIMRLQFGMFPIVAGFSYLCMSLSALIPSIALVWAAACTLFKCRGAAKSTIIFALVAEVVLVVATITLMIFYHNMKLSV